VIVLEGAVRPTQPASIPGMDMARRQVQDDDNPACMHRMQDLFVAADACGNETEVVGNVPKFQSGGATHWCFPEHNAFCPP
jgi:hypothetical protein